MAINVVESGYEPEIFKQAFKEGWQNYEHHHHHHQNNKNAKIEESSDEERKDSEEDDEFKMEANFDARKTERKQAVREQQTINNINNSNLSHIAVDLIPESYWIN